MRIDTHQHFWHFDPVRDAWITEDMNNIRKDFGPGDLYPLLQQEGFDGCVAVQAAQSEEETRYLLGLAEEYEFIKGVVGWADLQSEQVGDRLAEFTQNPQLKGIRHIVQSEPDDRFMLRKDFMYGISQLLEFQLVYDILIYPHQLPAAVEFVHHFEKQVFVLDHIAKPYIKKGILEPWTSQIREMAKAPNVYCKLSGMVTEADWHSWCYEDMLPYLEVVLEAFGTDRVMIGSDWPVCLVAADYGTTVGIVKRFIGQLSEVEQEGILGRNAVTCYQL